MSNPNETAQDIGTRALMQHQRDVTNKEPNMVRCRCGWHRTSSGRAGRRLAHHQMQHIIKALLGDKP